MVAFKIHLDVIGKFAWIGKMTYNVIRDLPYMQVTFFIVLRAHNE